MLRMAILGLSMTILSACTTARDALPAPSSLDLQRFRCSPSAMLTTG